jgi:predicted PurR-regulated permease PerM
MNSDFAIRPVPIDTYKLVIFNRYSPTVITQFHLLFHKKDDFVLENGDTFSFIENELPQLKQHLSEMLDEIPQEIWDKENVKKVVDQLMSESISSFSSHEVPGLSTSQDLV